MRQRPYGGWVQLAYIPSPTRNVWFLGPVPLRAYAIAIIVGIALAIVIADRRWRARGGKPGTVADIAVWAVIFGLIGGRLYHVATDPELYFGEGRHPIDAVKIWEGGLGIWGAIALGAVGAWLAARRKGIRFGAFADAAAPGIAIAQGVGRLGNWFNNELFGQATTKPWGLTVYNIDPNTHRAVEFNGQPEVRGHFQPTFLYELVWDLGVAGVVIWADRRFKLGRGRAFALYAMAYTAGRIWIEALRSDDANHILGLRLNIWTSAVVFLIALLYFVIRRGPREETVEAGTDGTVVLDDAQAGTTASSSEGSEKDESTTAGAADAADPLEPADTAEAEPDDAGVTAAVSNGNGNGTHASGNGARDSVSKADPTASVFPAQDALDENVEESAAGRKPAAHSTSDATSSGADGT